MLWNRPVPEARFEVGTHAEKQRNSIISQRVKKDLPFNEKSLI
jgi:hypothetical protein